MVLTGLEQHRLWSLADASRSERARYVAGAGGVQVELLRGECYRVHTRVAPYRGAEEDDRPAVRILSAIGSLDAQWRQPGGAE